jgi:protease-4
MNRLLNEILSSVWLIDSERSASYALFIHQLIEGKSNEQCDFSIQRAKSRSFVIASDGSGDQAGLNSETIPSGSIVVIPIRSEIMKYDQECGPRGTMSIIKDIQAANNNPNISGIVMIMDSPGGQVSGTDLLAKEVANSQKPIVTYVEGVCASAALWIASASDRIIASSTLDRIGSIGVMMAYADLKPYYEKMGVKFHEVYATQSTDKSKDFNDVLQGEYDNYKASVLDPICNDFIAHVKKYRSKCAEDALTGKMYFAQEAIANGLIDEIGTFEGALNLVSNLAIQQNNVQIKNDSMKFSAKWNAILSVLGLTGETAEAEEMTAERIGLLDQELADRKAKNDELQASLSAVSTEKQTALDQLAAELTAHAETKKQLEDLKAEDATGQTRVAKDKDKITGEGAGEVVNGFDKVADKFLGK